MKNYQEIVHKNVKKYAELRGMNANQLALKTGLSRQLTSTLFREPVNLRIDTLIRIATALGVDPRELLK